MKKRYAVAFMALLIFMVGTVACAEGGTQAKLSVDLTPIFQAFIGLLAALVTYRLLPWIKARTTAEQQQKLEGAVRIAVYGAEEWYRAGHGDEKLKHVQEYLAQQGYVVDVDTIKAHVNQMRDEKE